MIRPDFTMTSQGPANLESLLNILFQDRSKVVGYAIRPAEEGKRWDPDHLKDPKFAHLMSWFRKPKAMRIVFFWTDAKDTKDYVAFPFGMDAKGCADFVTRWLSEVDYGKEPDTDGHNQKGWTSYTARHGQIDDDWKILFAVSPEWITYGK